MRYVRLVAPLGLLVVLSGSSAALDCESSELTQSEMNGCAGAALKKADALLNLRYKKIVGCLKEQAQPLVESQRAWIKFRDAECKFQAGSREDGGTAWPMVMDGCLQSETEQRSKGLDYYLTCEEGDVSCPTTRCNFQKSGAKPK